MIWGVRSSRTVAIAIASAAFVVCCVLPVGAILAAALPSGVSAPLDARQRGLLFNTLVLGLGTATLATVAGAPLGFVLARTALPFKMPLRLALLSPALLPPYVVALAGVYLSEHLAAMLPALAIPGPYGLAGAIVALSFSQYPLAMLATEVGLRRVEARLEEAALLAVAPGRVLRRITAPLIAPIVLSAALMIFVLAIADFSVPAVLRARVFTTEIFTAFAALYDVERATALAIPLLGVSLVVAMAAAGMAAGRLVSTRRTAGAPAPMAFATWGRSAANVIVCLAIAALGVPVLVLGSEAFKAASSADVVRGSGQAAINSLLLAAIGATAITAIAGILGHARARAGAVPSAVVDVLCILLFSVPSTIVGVGLIAVWNRPGVPGMVYGTDVMLLLGYLARFLPVATLAVAATLRSVPASHEEAAAIAGARWPSTMRRIVLPQVRVGLAAVWVIVFILAFGEVGTSILIAPAGETTLPIRVFTLTANAPPGQLAVLALFQSAILLSPLAILGFVIASRKRT
jgi:iron(III) transport system permease protein